jgi:signal transduction histidine kinase
MASKRVPLGGQSKSDGDLKPGAHKASDVVLDPSRLNALAALGLLDTPPEEVFDRLTRAAAQILQAPVAMVSLVDSRRQFYKSKTDRTGPVAEWEAPLSHSYCKHVVATAEPLVVVDARDHPLLRDNPAIRDYGAIAYIGVPLRTADGFTLGSFCAIDTRPRKWPSHAIETLQALATAAMTEIALRTAGQQLRQANADLRRLEQERDELVHMVVHDLRSPLTSLMGGLDLLSDGALDERARDDLALARQGAESLLQLVNDVLEVSRAEAGELRLGKEETSPATIIAAACAQLAHLATAQKVVLTQSAGNLGPVLLDPKQILRVLVNLIANGIQHTPPDGQVVVSASAEPGGVQFSIQDSGSGVPPHVRGRIFEKFGAATSNRKSGASTGLGLALSKLIVEAHGGRIWVDDADGSGARFCFLIPAR